MSDRSLKDIESDARALTAEIASRRQRLQMLSRRHKEYRDTIDQIEQKTKVLKSQYHELKEAPVIIMDEYQMAIINIEGFRKQLLDTQSELRFTERQIKDTEESLRLLECSFAKVTQELGTFGKVIPFRTP